MKKSILLFLATVLFAKVHTVQIEPYEIDTIKAAVSGLVVKSAIEKEGKYNKDTTLIQIDDRLDRKNLSLTKKRLQTVMSLIELTKKDVENAKKVMQIKKANYERIKNLSSKSVTEKQRRQSEYLLAKGSYLATAQKLANLQLQKLQILSTIDSLQDTIEKKKIAPRGYIYTIYIKRGSYVVPGTPLVDVAYTNRAKVTLYLTKEERQNIEKKRVYIDGKPINAHWIKILKITDKTYPTQYRAELEVDVPKIFGKFIEVEIR